MNQTSIEPNPKNLTGKKYTGVYGEYTITNEDKIEVFRYRIAVLACGISFISGLLHWILIGPSLAWVWLIPMEISLGLALYWIHIYLRPLQLLLQLFWVLGCIGSIILAIRMDTSEIFSYFANTPTLTLAVGPLFAALTGLGFKEFFCFRRTEAIGLTIITPIALLGYLIGILNSVITMILLISSALLLVILAVRKFGTDEAADIGDKSVFEYLKSQEIS